MAVRVCFLLFFSIQTMRKICLLIVYLCAFAAWADDYVVLSPSFVPQALLARQIAPGTQRFFSFTTNIGACDECNISGKIVSTSEDPQRHYSNDKIDGSGYRFDMKLYDFRWPKTENTSGAEHWEGNRLGGGFFLNASYSAFFKVGLYPMVVQWLGPIYLAATYDLTFGCYLGRDEDEATTIDIRENLLTGSLNVGGGTMVFMNNHGLGVGLHGGLRQMHIINPGSRAYTGTDYRTGNRIDPALQDGYHVENWIYYYGIDFVGYTNIPLLKESNTKNHQGYIFSFEMGTRPDDNPLIYWAFSMSLLL